MNARNGDLRAARAEVVGQVGKLEYLRNDRASRKMWHVALYQARWNVD